MTQYPQGSLSDRLYQRILVVSPSAAVSFAAGLHAGGHWSLCQNEKSKICSFLRSLVSDTDTESRLTLYPGIEDEYFLNEVMSDVFPKIQAKLENSNGT